MKNILDKLKNKKTLFIVALVLVLVIGASWAFLAGFIGDGVELPINVTTDLPEEFIFKIDHNLTLIVNQTTLTEGGGNVFDSTPATATFRTAKNRPEDRNYNVYLEIEKNEYIYTTKDNKPEIILKVEGPNGEIIDNIPDLVYHEDLGGYDVTMTQGLIHLATQSIHNTYGDTPTVQNWKFTLTFINLDTNQKDNANKDFNANIIMQEEEYVEPQIFTDYIQSQFTADTTEIPAGDGKLYHHTDKLLDGSGDGSYRYAGNNPNNFVCLGEIQGDGSCDNVQNLYRIIGMFPFSEDGVQQTTYNDGMEYRIKLIKSEYITEQELKGTTTENQYGDSSSALTLYTADYTPRVKNTGEINGFYWNNVQYESWTQPSSNKYNLWEYQENAGDNKVATLNKSLNDSENGYLKTIGATWADKIANTTWHIAGGNSSELYSTTPYNALQVEMKGTTTGSYPAPQTTSQAKIGLMYVSDYGYAAANVNNLWTKTLGNGYNSDDNRQNNWMYNGVYEWTISRYSSNSSSAFNVSNGNVNNNAVNSRPYGVRPVFYLNSNVKLVSGNGSIFHPYKIQ